MLLDFPVQYEVDRELVIAPQALADAMPQFMRLGGTVATERWLRQRDPNGIVGKVEHFRVRDVDGQPQVWVRVRFRMAVTGIHAQAAGAQLYPSGGILVKQDFGDGSTLVRNLELQCLTLWFPEGLKR